MTAMRKTESPAMTYADYCLLPDDGKRYQVIEGELIESPSPNFKHQNAVWNLGELMRGVARSRDLGVVVGAPMGVILEPNTIVQPDLLFIRHGNMGIIGDVIEGPPDLCVEVLSPSTGLTTATSKALSTRAAAYRSTGSLTHGDHSACVRIG